MPSVQFEGRTVDLAEGETVLEALLRTGHQVPNSCRAGACQSCLTRAIEGMPPRDAQQSLSDARKAEGYFLSCVARPSEDLAIDLGGDGIHRARVRIESVERMSLDVLRVRLAPQSPFDHRPGQFLTLIRDNGLARSYSIASLAGRDRHLELHVRLLPDGRMGRWLADEVRPGELATVQGPSGHCFYTPGREAQGMILAGTGTGLAPLYGIAQDALRQDHSGPITLFHGAREPGGLYLHERLRELEAAHPSFRYVPCCLESDGRRGVEVGRLEAVLLGSVSTFAGLRVYLCGNPAMVQSLRKVVFLKGASVKDILADAFLAAPPPPQM